MLEKEKIILETNKAIKWIKSYVEASGAKGVIVRKQWRKRFSDSYCNGSNSFRKRKSACSINAM